MPDRRPIQFPVAIGIRLDDRTYRALLEAARERGLKPTELARDLIARGLDLIDRTAPIRRRSSPIRDMEEMRLALHLLGECGGNLQRCYTTLAASGRADADLLEVKTELRQIADTFRAALRPRGDA